ncbi:MAG: transporter substrate-binding domain-containing protein [Candidatus Adiutrix sp.]|jgi:ABC-type amino acid transport substrate-binding protein|nr:transporter substrate-binding domain-containing protein [Candidatus Adiutrix sp.]
MKRLVFAFMAAWALAASAAAADDRVYKVAVDPDYPPFSYTDEKTGQLSGFDVDIARAVCAKLALNCDIRPVLFDDIIPQVADGRLDIGCAGFAYTEERARRVLFTKKYFRSTNLFIGPPDAFEEVTAETLRGKKAAVQAGTIQEAYLRKTYGQVLAIIPMSGFGEVTEAVKNKTADIGFVDGLPGYSYLKSEEGLELDIVGDPVHLDSADACMALTPGLEPLRDRINQAIEDLRLSGEYDAINVKYFDFSVY